MVPRRTCGPLGQAFSPLQVPQHGCQRRKNRRTVTSDDDPRITRLGNILRKYKLDELPELINVLVGDMSLVGPRPEVQSEVDLYTDEERLLLAVRPGITDYASIEFHDEGEILKGAPIRMRRTGC